MLLSLGFMTACMPMQKRSAGPQERPVGPNRTNALAVGKRAPDFSLRDANNAFYRLGRLRGQTVLIDFFRTDCEPCVKALPELVRFSRDHDDVKVFVIALLEDEDGRNRLNRFFQDNPVPFPVLIDYTETWAQQFMGPVTLLPAAFLVDGNGVIAARQFEANADGGAFAAIEAALKK